MNSIEELQSIIFENKTKIKENDYIKLMKNLKDVYKEIYKNKKLHTCSLDLNDELECPCCNEFISTEEWINTNNL